MLGYVMGDRRLIRGIFLMRAEDIPIVAQAFAFVFLLDAQGAKQVASDDHSRMGRRSVDDQSIQRVAILTKRRWNEAPIVGIDAAHRQGSGILEDMGVRLIGQLGGRSSGCLDNHANLALLMVGNFTRFMTSFL